MFASAISRRTKNEDIDPNPLLNTHGLRRPDTVHFRQPTLHLLLRLLIGRKNPIALDTLRKAIPSSDGPCTTTACYQITMIRNPS